MKILILSIYFLFSSSFSEYSICYNDSIEKINYSKVKIKIASNGQPLSNVLVVISQNNKHLGESITDDDGKTIITCKYLDEGDKNVEILAKKEGFQSFKISGSLITTITDYEFSMVKEGVDDHQSRNLNFQFEYEELKASF